jgi:prepilin-type N-terminal cleavage/methylation domain-containing protein
MTLKRLKELKKNKKGFTLIEIIVVVVILAVLMAIAVPAVMKYIDEADNAKYMAQARGAFITAEAEVAKDYLKGGDSTKGTWTATKTIVDEIGGTPTVTGITAKVDGKGNVTEVTVTFDGKTATVNPNEEVIIK